MESEKSELNSIAAEFVNSGSPVRIRPSAPDFEYEIRATAILDALANQPLQQAVVAGVLHEVAERERTALQRVNDRGLKEETLAFLIDGLDEE